MLTAHKEAANTIWLAPRQALGLATILGYLLGRPKACIARNSFPNKGSLYSLETIKDLKRNAIAKNNLY